MIDGIGKQLTISFVDKKTFKRYSTRWLSTTNMTRTKKKDEDHWSKYDIGRFQGQIWLGDSADNTSSILYWSKTQESMEIEKGKNETISISSWTNKLRFFKSKKNQILIIFKVLYPTSDFSKYAQPAFQVYKVLNRIQTMLKNFKWFILHQWDRLYKKFLEILICTSEKLINIYVTKQIMFFWM